MYIKFVVNWCTRERKCHLQKFVAIPKQVWNWETKSIEQSENKNILHWFWLYTFKASKIKGDDSWEPIIKKLKFIFWNLSFY